MMKKNILYIYNDDFSVDIYFYVKKKIKNEKK